MQTTLYVTLLIDSSPGGYTTGMVKVSDELFRHAQYGLLGRSNPNENNNYIPFLEAREEENRLQYNPDNSNPR